MRYEIIGGRSFGRTGDRGREPAGAEDGEFVFVSGGQHLVRVRRRVRPRDRKKLGFWCKMNIHEAQKLGSVRLAEREVEATSRRVQRTENSFLYPVRRIWFASGVEFDRGIEETGFWCKINIHTLMNNIHDLTHPYVMNSVSILEEISRILGHADRFRVIFEK